MPKLLELNSFHDSRGSLSVIEKIIPFEIRRVFYIYNVDESERGKHRHHKTIQAAICVSGSCLIQTDNGIFKESYLLDKPDKCLILYPEDFHTMSSFSNGAVLLVLASEYFDKDDYIYQPYE